MRISSPRYCRGPHGLRDLEVTAPVEIFDREGERLEGLAPQLVDPLVAAAMSDHLAQGERLLEMLTALAHEGVVGLDLDPQRLDLDHLGKDVGGPVEEGARQLAP